MSVVPFRRQRRSGPPPTVPTVPEPLQERIRKTIDQYQVLMDRNPEAAKWQLEWNEEFLRKHLG
jgi:hypothetical protein